LDEDGSASDQKGFAVAERISFTMSPVGLRVRLRRRSADRTLQVVS
jgi:hypothetical protein